MSRLVPHPLLSLALVLMWLLLTRFSLGHLLLGVVIALIAGWALGKVEPERPRLRRIWPLIRLMGIVSVDIIRSNIAVAGLILTRGRHGARKSAFVDIPLRLDDPVPLALLAMIITATPGTAWLEHDPDTGVLILHVFDVIDEDEWRHLIRDRYESLLLEAFG
ncbi:Na+/H+ antiporter subunit E [Ruixingdingia sedimenti]|uniref:Na+/H+ antiporter subunit E n=1 Tax=Ruixingdingia sedimenti TaxID=3073604 RepID=A0ABU1F5I7_9RHOB|nr:Na+/H+ antiporter subunit E [Xinfangfangia sp. LG-4]MDR5651692.1 Na+/H+ antiporter subunit E [Xinfangfangia sp. LG-4]